MLDLIAPTPTECQQAAEAIERLRSSGPVLVCCALGYSRSATAVAAWLLHSGRAATVDQALAIIRTARAHVVLHPAHRQALEVCPMPADMELQVVASLLRRGRSLDQLSTGLTVAGVLFGLAQLLMASISTICLLLSLWMIILGLLQNTGRCAWPSTPTCSPCWPATSTAPRTLTRPCKPLACNRPSALAGPDRTPSRRP